MTVAEDLWYHYGRRRAVTDRAVPETFRWAWSQRGGPGAEVLGELEGRRVGDLGAGAGRDAAYLVSRYPVARVDAVDGSAAQHAMGRELYGDLAPRLRLVHADAVAHLHRAVGEYDVLYSVFGAVDFTDPYELLPAVCAALRPGGRLVFATLAHYVGGAPARGEVVPARISARRPDGEAATMARWVLREEVWAEVLGRAGLTRVSSEVLPGSGEGARDADTLLVTAFRGGAAAGHLL